jgi:hypothetical protein
MSEFFDSGHNPIVLPGGNSSMFSAGRFPSCQYGLRIASPDISPAALSNVGREIEQLFSPVCRRRLEPLGLRGN